MPSREFELRCGDCGGKEARLRGRTPGARSDQFIELTVTCVKCGSVNTLRLTATLGFFPVEDSPGTFCGPWKDDNAG